MKPMVGFEWLSFKPKTPVVESEWLDILLGELRVEVWGCGELMGPGSPEARLGKSMPNGQWTQGPSLFPIHPPPAAPHM